MLTILFSPSEGKHSGGFSPLHRLLFDIKKRQPILDAYNKVLSCNDFTVLEKMFGLKKHDAFTRYLGNLFTSPTRKAFERYDGVAYDYLDYPSLNSEAQHFLDEHCIIFSNLYGPIKGGDLITDYKVKQGERIGEIAPEVFYADHFSDDLNHLLQKSDILDLRAGYYDKFYKPTQPYTTLKFIKNGKVVSHWAKAYRGIVLREIAKAGIDSLESFMQLEIESLHIKEIKQLKQKREIVFDIKPLA